MDGSIRLSAKERKSALRVCQRDRLARRAHVVLLLAAGWRYREVQAALFVGPGLIRRVKRAFDAGGVAQVLAEKTATCIVAAWLLCVLRWLAAQTPRDFGFVRSRWSCALLAALLWEKNRVRLSPETVRRGLRRQEYVWRRPRPVVGPTDPEHAVKLRHIQRLLRTLPADATAVFQDEVDVHLNPKIGAMWMRRGEQAEVVTPGNNEKRHLAGSLHWRTGRLLLSAPVRRRDAALFVAHLDDLRHRLRSYRVIHVICDNARFHDCRAVRDYLEGQQGRIVLHYLPKYAPETNPIERVWWHLHETVTRNHRCRTLDELLAEVQRWLAQQPNYAAQTDFFKKLYPLAA
jgi:transposase